jgi:RNA polymerase sigma-70 factor, ECF subfamily
VSHDQFEALVATHLGEIYRYLLVITGRMADADDLSQETFVRAFETRRSPGQVTRARAWLFAIATELARSRLRSRRRQARGPIETDGRVTKDGRHPLATSMTRLPAEHQIALVLRKLHGFDYEVIGGMLGCSSQSARGRVMRAFWRLARMRSVRSALSSVETPIGRGVPAPATPGAPT